MNVDTSNNNNNNMSDQQDNQSFCNTIGCNNQAEYKITTLDHKFIFMCLKHHDSTLADNKDNVFNIIQLED